MCICTTHIHMHMQCTSKNNLHILYFVLHSGFLSFKRIFSTPPTYILSFRVELGKKSNKNGIEFCFLRGLQNIQKLENYIYCCSLSFGRSPQISIVSSYSWKIKNIPESVFCLLDQFLHVYFQGYKPFYKVLGTKIE